MRKNYTPTYEVWTNTVTEGYVRKNYTPIYEVWTNTVTEGYVRKNYTPIYEVWTNTVTEGYVRSTLAASLLYAPSNFNINIASNLLNPTTC